MSQESTVRYPWDDWLSKPAVQLERGIDYVCQPHAMAQQVRNAAAARGLRVTIRITEGILQVGVSRG